MKTSELILLCTLLLSFPTLKAQVLNNFGGGEYPRGEKINCLTDQERQVIQEEIATSIHQLTQQGVLKPQIESRAAVSLGWPLAPAPELDWESYYGVSNYVDQQAGSGTRDYTCSSTTYNSHKGTDYFTFPFPWHLYQNNLVNVVAAAAGTIVGKIDGNTDLNCQWEGADNWNAIYVRHSDGSVAWYGHMKAGGLTSKVIGDQVEKGEFLGVVASSGRSSDPHLHFEVYDENYSLIDPYAGACNSMNNSSWWDEQPPYSDPHLNAVLTHSAPPRFGCPLTSERPNFKEAFAKGEQVYMAAYIRDQITGQRLDWTIERPDGTVWNNWDQTVSGNFQWAYSLWSWYLPADAPSGTWKIKVQYLNQMVERTFEYGSVVSSTVASTNEIGVQFFPNPARNQIQLKGLSKKADLTLYNVYGEIILQQVIGPETQRIDLSTLSPGVHFAKIALDGKYYQQKIVVL